LDVGGGTGLNRPYLPIGWKYFCLDPDPQKLEGFRARFPSDEAVKASACEIPFDNESIDLCIMTAVSHHLTNEKFRLALCEIRRVLRPGGKFMLMDAVWNPANLIGRFLWSLDRGSFPRNTEKLEHFIQTELFIERRVFWKVHHEYALFWCSKKDR
jgi:SAM-dependent methyltransferase